MEIVDDGKVTIDIDWVMANYSRDELLSALGFDQPSDFLDEVTVADAVDYYGEFAVVEHITISDHWDMEDAYNRYGSEYMEDYYSDYQNTSDWTVADFIDGYGDSVYMLEVLLERYVPVDQLYEALPNSYEEPLVKLINPKPKVRHELVGALLKANYENLRSAQC